MQGFRTSEFSAAPRQPFHYYLIGRRCADGVRGRRGRHQLFGQRDGRYRRVELSYASAIGKSSTITSRSCAVTVAVAIGSRTNS